MTLHGNIYNAHIKQLHWHSAYTCNTNIAELIK